MNDIFKYTVPARIAINLYDMNGNLGRIDGGMGFSIKYPRLVFTAQKSTSIKINDVNGIVEIELLNELKSKLKIVAREFFLTGVEITILESIPLHSGFGSKTATLLSIAHSFGKVHNKKIDFKTLAIILKRGGTSGLGVNLINKGGFILEGGHSTDIKKSFTPSSFTKEIRIAPILAHYKMPNWNLMLITPKLKALYGEKELSFFKNICPISEQNVEKVARITLSCILPSICEENLSMFCLGITKMQSSEWKSSEISLYNNEISNLMLMLKNKGAGCVGMSSVGPTLYVFGENLENLYYEFKNVNSLSSKITITKPCNSGMKIKKV